MSFKIHCMIMIWIEILKKKKTPDKKKRNPVPNSFFLSHYQHSRFICFPAFLIACAWDGLCVGWGGWTEDGATVSEGESGSRPENNRLIQICSVAQFLLLLPMKKDDCKKDECDEYGQTEKWHFSEMHACQCTDLYVSHPLLLSLWTTIYCMLKWFHLLLKAMCVKW